MGALTDSRKRLSADHCLSADHRLPYPSFPPPSLTPPSKRAKLAPFPELDPSTSTVPPIRPSPQIIHSTATASASSTPGPSSSCITTASTPLPQRRRLPPPPPIQRPIHAPQRNLRVFRLGGAARTHAAGYSWFSPSSPPPRSLGLQQFVELVKSVSHPAPPTPAATTDATRQAEAEADAVPLEVITIEEDKEVRKQQDEEVRGGVVVRRGPIYKELYKASQQKRDAKLKTLEFEVRLAEEGRLGLERLAEALPRITPKKEVWLSWILLFIFHIVL